ncbi:lysozyme inhibitor LprI family protein [Luteimonas suaedae]|uniref:lysozyme inhibitor LprI family protein n=1 Tax=Luteimonas suaedae TaxID=2605430 RepID=UPI0011EE72DA|nr:hypothetical protein [Luteimonas suaedae]
MIRHLVHIRLRAGLLSAGLLLGAGANAADDTLDCDAPGSWAERTVCRTPALRALDAQLRQRRADALLRSDDTAAFTAEQRDWIRDKRDACTTVRCLETSYRTQIDALGIRIASSEPPLLQPGEYHQVTRSGPVPGAPVLRVERRGQRRYLLRVLDGPDAPDGAIEGAFIEQVGAADFSAGDCRLHMSFAPDLIAVSAASGCGDALDGAYRRVPSEP